MKYPSAFVVAVLCTARGALSITTEALGITDFASSVTVPAIEAWYLCGRDSTVSEAAWTAGQASGRQPYSRAELKWRVYGTDRPTLQATPSVDPPHAPEGAR